MESYGGKDEVVNKGEKEDDEEEGRESDEDESDGDEEVIESTSGSPGDDCPFTLIFCFFGHVIGKKKCMNKMRHSYS